MAEANKQGNIFARGWARFKRWCREMRSELKKVVWPTKSQMINNTIIVAVCVLIVGVFIWIFDGLANLVVQGIFDILGG